MKKRKDDVSVAIAFAIVVFVLISFFVTFLVAFLLRGDSEGAKDNGDHKSNVIKYVNITLNKKGA